MPLYHLQEGTAKQIKQISFSKEKELQGLFEENLETLFGVRFVATEFTTGDRQRGRIDSLGLDQDGSPTIVEYKKTSKGNIINQGLFYLDWLVDHKGDFTLAVQEVLDNDIQIDWSNPRLILVAESFSDYDKYAVNRIGANIELWIFRRYSEELLYLEPIFAASSSAKKQKSPEKSTEEAKADSPIYTVEEHLKGKPEKAIELFETLREKIFELGDDEAITEKANKLYISYKHGKNFCEVKIQNQGLKLWVDISYQELNDPKDFGKDVTDIGHHGTGSVEIRLIDQQDIDDVMELISQSYQQTI
jgi:predicted transport protein